MRRLAVLLLVGVVACSQGQELAVTSTTNEEAPDNTTQERLTTTTADVTTTTEEPSSSTTTSGALTPLQSLTYVEVESVGFPIHLIPWPGVGGELLATKDGRVFEYGNGVVGDLVLDISSQVRDNAEQGLLAIAANEDNLYVHYSANNGDTVVSEFPRVGNSFDRAAENQLLTVDQPAGNHNGGMIQFGPDGRLYLGLGDGGRSNDFFGNGQNRNTLLAGLVAIDVETAESELFQYGLRNPWRFWIEDDLIYIADVGQNAFEEISVAPLEADLNYGWPITEGLHCFRPSSGCDASGLTLPVVEVSHRDSGTCSITGGVVYRGSEIPELDGVYLYSDFCGGYLRGLLDGEATDYTEQVGVPGRVASFGTDADGEVYVLTTNRIFKLAAERG